MSEPNSESMSARTVESVKDEVGKYIAKVIIAAAAGILGIAALGIWIYVKTQLPGIVGGVPPGAVLAFDLPSGCPAGWTSFQRGISRMIIGANTSGAAVSNQDRNGQPLMARAYQSDGGEENTPSR